MDLDAGAELDTMEWRGGGGPARGWVHCPRQAAPRWRMPGQAGGYGARGELSSAEEGEW